MTNFIIKYRWAIIAVSVILGVGFGLLIPTAETDPDIRNYIPRSMASRVTTDSIEETFGVQDMIITVFTDSMILTPENLEQIKEVDKAYSQLPGIGKINSLFTARDIKSDDGMMVVNPLVDKMPQTQEDYELLKENILENQFARDIVVSSDLTSAAITGTINADIPEYITLRKIDSVLASHQGKAEVLSGGLPYIRRNIINDVKHDGLVLIPLALIIMLLVLKLTLGDWNSVLMPFLVVVLSAAVSMGMIPLFGWKMSILSLLVPIIMISVANNYGIYLAAGHQELCRSDIPRTKKEMIRSLSGMLSMPILFSGLTTIAGILGLLAHSIIPARQVGVLAAIGVTLALLMSLMLIPAIIYTRKPVKIKLQDIKEKGDILDKVIDNIAKGVTKRPGRALLVTGVHTLLISSGMLLLRIDTNQENYFPKKHTLSRASKLINSKFGGSQTISVMISGDIKDPEIMKCIDDLTSHVEKQEGVGHVFSISDVVRAMSKALFEPGEEGYDQIPTSYEAISQMFELYNMSGDPDDFSQLMNFENTKAHMLVQLSKPDNEIVKAIRDDIKTYTAAFPAQITVGGYAIIMDEFAQKIIKGQVSSLLFALLTVFILLSIIFKSIRGGLVGSIPLAASILIQFGAMGIIGIAIDSATALLSSIMIGVGVDFTIQFLWRYNHELTSGLSHNEAIGKTYRTTGRSIIVNALGVMSGFSATFFSGFLSIRFFGYMILLSIGSCLLYAIIVIPAFMLWFKPKFIEADLNNRNKKENKNGKDVINVSIPAGLRASISAATRSDAANAEKP